MLPERQLPMEGRPQTLAPHPSDQADASDTLRGFAARWTEEDEERLVNAIRDMPPASSLSEMVRRLRPSFQGRSDKGMYRHLVSRMERDRAFAALVRERIPGTPGGPRTAPLHKPAAGPAPAPRSDEPQALVAAAQLLEEHLGAMSRHDAERLAALYRRFGSIPVLTSVASAVVGRMSMLLDEVERRLRTG